MNRKHFTWLAVLAVVATIAVLLLPGEPVQDVAHEEQLLMPALQEQANGIRWLQVSAAGNEVVATLVRSGAGWKVEEAGGYRADWNVLRPLLSGLAAARVVEPKTSNPEYFNRLGVEDIQASDASGIQLGFDSSTGLPAVILGNDAQGREGQYARLVDSQQSVLIDRSLQVPADRASWMDRRIVDISDNEVVEVEVRHADGERVLARKISADDSDFVLEGVENGFEPTSTWAVNSLAGALSSLDLDEVAPDDRFNWTPSSQFRLLSADGLNVEVELVAVPASGEDSVAKEARWIRLQAGLYTTALDSGVERAGDESSTEARAEAINDRVSGWAYRIPDYKFDAMNKRMADLVQAIEPES